MNPYEPPKATQKPAGDKQDLFVRLQKYQWRGFYSGLIIVITTTIFKIINRDTVVGDIFDVLGAVGAVLLFLSLGSILPLSVWGFIKGYRESRGG